jgi:SNF2 family DNA or RNA helicase
MVRVLDLLEDYCYAKRLPFERLDGGVKGAERQAAIDRYSVAFYVVIAVTAVLIFVSIDGWCWHR